MKHIATLFLVVMTMILTGCASVPMASGNQDINAKSFATVNDKANLYIYRNEFVGAAIPMGVDINGKSIGQTVAKTYLNVLLDPGDYTLQSHAENDSTLPITVEAGKNYFVWQEVKMGFLSARSLLQVVDETTGRAGVAESNLVASASLSESPPVAQQSDVAPEVSATPQVVSVSAVEPQVISLPQPDPAPVLNQSAPTPVVMNKHEIRSGISAFAVEKLARRQACQFERGADLTGSNGPTIESYELQCNDGRVMKAQCEYRQCALIQ